jgi:hypothetical protein
METVPTIPPLWQAAILAWSIVWKGLALWGAAKNSQRNWFIVILVINTLGILEILFLFKFAKKRMILSDLYFWKPKSKA